MCPPTGKVQERRVKGLVKEERPSSERDDMLFKLFAAAVAEPSTADVACRQLLTQFVGADVKVHWEDLHGIDPELTLASAVAVAIHDKAVAPQLLHMSANDHSNECGEWWQAFLERFGLHGKGDSICATEFGEMAVSAFRMLRDRCASDAYLRNVRTVHSGSVRLRCRYTEFEFVSRGEFGKHYRCQSRLSREEHLCRQVRKDRLGAPADHARSELELLRSLEHRGIPQIVESFEDFNNMYIVGEPAEGTEMLAYLQERYASRSPLNEAWVVEVVRQVMEALRYCHEFKPHSVVHGDLRVSSMVLASFCNANLAPHVLITDLGLAGLPQSPPPRRLRRRPRPMPTAPLLSRGGLRRGAAPSPALDIWSAGCIICLLLGGRRPDAGDPTGPLQPPEDFELDLDRLTSGNMSQLAVALCTQMLVQDPRARLGAAECLRHEWFVPTDPEERQVPLEALGEVVRAHQRSALRRAATNLVVAELSDSPFSCLAAAGSVLSACAGGAGEAALGAEAAPPGALARLGVSVRGVEKVVQAFGPCSAAPAGDYEALAAEYLELAEDLLDHALWRLFAVAGEDHRGIVSVSALEEILDARDARSWGPSTLSGRKVAETVRQIARGHSEVSFEDVKDAIIRKQAGWYTAAETGGEEGTGPASAAS